VSDSAVLELVARRLEELALEIRRSSGTALPVPAETSKGADVDSEHISANELAQILDVDARTIRRWSHLGRMPRPTRVGNTLRWRRSTIDMWLKERAR
jgi:excisionase family DNA binding protein